MPVTVLLREMGSREQGALRAGFLGKERCFLTEEWDFISTSADIGGERGPEEEEGQGETER